MPESLRIVVPSRARSQNMKRLLKLLPTALVCVARSEKEDYSKVVPANQLLFHDEIKGLVNIRNWINAKIQEDCVVMSDDDLLCVRPLIGKQRPITDPAVILQIINNSHVVCQDLGINVFCWSRTRNSFLAGPDGNPIRLVQPMAATWGLRGAARERKFDTTLPARPDLDFTMETLLKDRILYADMRFYFDHGRSFTGRGGNVGILSHESWEATTKLLYKKWGKYIGTSKPGWVKTKGQTSVMSIRVKRGSIIGKGV
ncbi:MAG: hypothetical protein ABSA16_02175 [Thermoguttaceae bacterium]